MRLIKLFEEWYADVYEGRASNFLSFEEAREYVQSLGLRNFIEWQGWAKSPERPENIPFDPYRTYKDKGWMGYGDWLGTGNVRGAKTKDFLPFEEAREYVQSLGLRNYIEWQEWAKSPERPENIPASPNISYIDKGWISYGDWLGTGNLRGNKKDFLPFEEAREYVQSLGLKNIIQWKEWASSPERPDNIPTNPYIAYKDEGWMGYGDWLGTGNIRGGKTKDFLSFEEAREYVQSLGLKNMIQWQEWASSPERPDNIPANPYAIYKDEGWMGYGDWLGTGNLRGNKKDFLPFEDARKYVQSLGLRNFTEWQEWASSPERPENIPFDPYTIYKDEGWMGYGDWLGTGNLRGNKKDFLSFEEAREYVQSLGLKGVFQWKEWAKSPERPDNIPTNPNISYRDKGWAGYRDWIGTNKTEMTDYVSYDLAKEMIQPYEIKSPEEWVEYSKMNLMPKNIPHNPSLFYADKGWIGWEDFLGTNI